MACLICKSTCLIYLPIALSTFFGAFCVFLGFSDVTCEAAAVAVVNSLRLDNFAPGCAENPKLQRHYAAIQAGHAVALGVPVRSWERQRRHGRTVDAGMGCHAIALLCHGGCTASNVSSRIHVTSSHPQTRSVFRHSDMLPAPETFELS